MKKITLLLLAFCFSTMIVSAQQSNTSATQLKTDKYGWTIFSNEFKQPPAEVFKNKELFDLQNADEMELIGTFNDNLGYSHYRFRQLHNGFPVEGAEYTIHSSGGKAISGNGKIIRGMKHNSGIALNPGNAVQKALTYVGAEEYMWENPLNEQFIKYQTNNPQASYYPEAELVYINKNFSSDPAAYVLCYKINVYAQKPLSRQYLYINALNGELYHKINLIRNDNVNGTAVTKYSGTVNITTDSTAPGNYRLRETGRGNGIETYDMNQTTNYSAAVDFTDADNNWNNVNAQMDEVATDAHFGAEMTYDYYFIKHGRNSYDNSGAKLISYIHYDQNYDNAFWDGNRMTYGDGDGSSTSPFTSLDVCGHEITHAVTEYSANLVYQNEHGAMNEAFSDIFGTCIEFYASPANADWFIGEDFDLTAGGNGFRNMMDPNEDQQPDTYHGQYWYTGSLDNGGVHINNSLGNFWFYLLTEGGSGVNDNGDSYAVNGIGIDSAAQITYRTLTVYLTPTSEYYDMRLASIQAAIDLYGPCSGAAIDVANAWFAVGVGQGVSDNDVYISEVLSPKTDCGLSLEQVSVRMIYNGCNVPLVAGDTIYFYYTVDAGSVTGDTLVLISGMNGGDTLDFTFSTPADVSTLGNHSLKCWLHFGKDTIASNDTLSDYQFINKLYQNSDVGITAILSPVSECHLSNMEDIEVEIGFFGCEFLPAGSKIALAYQIGSNTPVYDTLTTMYDITPDSLITFTFNTPADLSGFGTYTIKAWTDFDIDSLNTNDAFNNYTVKNPVALSDTVVNFDVSGSGSMFLIDLAPRAHAWISSAAHNTGPMGFLMTGGNPFDYYDQLDFPNGLNNWIINDFLSAKITFCIDATQWTTANMHFDLKQTHGGPAYEMFLGSGNDYTKASSLRILVNGTDQIGGTYNPVSASSDAFVTHFVNLDAYAGTKFTVTFESRNISKDTMGFTMDNAYLDNIAFSEISHIGMDDNGYEANLNIYPNPFNKTLIIKLFAETGQKMHLNIYDIDGRSVMTYSSELSAGINEIRLDMGHLPAGMYFVNATTMNKVVNTKVVKN